MDGYKVEGSKKAGNKIIYYWLFISVWYLLKNSLYSIISGCSDDLSVCTTEQFYTFLKLQSFNHFPIVIFFIYIGYYSFKVIWQKRIPPSGNRFPFTIPLVINRDHYTFGVTGIILSIIVLFSFVYNVYHTYKITGI